MFIVQVPSSSAFNASLEAAAYIELTKTRSFYTECFLHVIKEIYGLAHLEEDRCPFGEQFLMYNLKVLIVLMDIECF